MRDKKGRFVKGHKALCPRDNKGRFISDKEFKYRKAVCEVDCFLVDSRRAM